MGGRIPGMEPVLIRMMLGEYCPHTRIWWQKLHHELTS